MSGTELRRPFTSSTPSFSSPASFLPSTSNSPPLPFSSSTSTGFSTSALSSMTTRTSSSLLSLLLRTRWPYFLSNLILLSLLFFSHNPSPTFSSKSQSMQQQHPHSHSLPTESYRQQLERTTSAPWVRDLWPTLTFDHIYVLSLPGRKDRREKMDKIASALGLRLTYVDAWKKDDDLFKWVAEQVHEVRKTKARLMAQARKVPVKSIGGLKINSDWLAATQDLSGTIPFPDLPSPTWIDQLENAYNASTLIDLEPRSRHVNVSKLLYDPLDPASGRQVNEGVLSTFWGHTRALQLVVENKDRTALILEDDVDLEFDINRLWGRVHSKLPFDWDTVFLGHCWGRELLKPAYLHPYLHLSTSPMCLHSYGVTLSGARHLLTHLLDPWTAFQVPIDTAVPTLIQSNKLVSFSVEPPLIIQRKDGPSDIHGGKGSRWKGLLRDSTWERILRDEGAIVPEEDWEVSGRDPANMFRYKTTPCD